MLINIMEKTGGDGVIHFRKWSEVNLIGFMFYSYENESL